VLLDRDELQHFFRHDQPRAFPRRPMGTLGN
jgi:hypothetical protein